MHDYVLSPLLLVFPFHSSTAVPDKCTKNSKWTHMYGESTAGMVGSIVLDWDFQEMRAGRVRGLKYVFNFSAVIFS